MTKTNIFINISVILLFSLLFISCNENAKSAATQEKTVEVKPIKIAPLLDRSDALAQLSEWKDIKKTVAELQQKLAKNPADYKSAIYLAALYMQEARISGEHPYYYPESLKILDHVIAHQKDKSILFEALTHKASVQLSQHEFEQALELGKQALALQSHSAKVYGILCDAHVELGNYKKAVQMADKMVALRPDLRSYSRVSYLRELHGDYAGAVEAMELAIGAGLPGTEATTWCRITLGNLHLEHGNTQKAMAQFENALKERPNFAFAIAGKAAVAQQKGELDKSLALLEQAAAVMPEFSFYESMAHIYQQQGNTKKVNTLTDELLTMLKEDQESGHNMNLELAGIYLGLADDKETALAYAQKEYQKRPNNIEVNHTLANIYFAKGAYYKAIIHANKALQTNVQDAELICLSGIAQFKTGQQQKGKSLIKKAFSINAQLNGELAADAKKIINGQS